MVWKMQARIDFSIFDKDYCEKPDPKLKEGEGIPAMIDTNQVDCTKLMEFLYPHEEICEKNAEKRLLR